MHVSQPLQCSGRCQMRCFVHPAVSVAGLGPRRVEYAKLILRSRSPRPPMRTLSRMANLSRLTRADGTRKPLGRSRWAWMSRIDKPSASVACHFGITAKTATLQSGICHSLNRTANSEPDVRVIGGLRARRALFKELTRISIANPQCLYQGQKGGGSGFSLQIPAWAALAAQLEAYCRVHVAILDFVEDHEMSGDGLPHPRSVFGRSTEAILPDDRFRDDFSSRFFSLTIGLCTIFSG